MQRPIVIMCIDSPAILMGSLLSRLMVPWKLKEAVVVLSLRFIGREDVVPAVILPQIGGEPTILGDGET